VLVIASNWGANSPRTRGERCTILVVGDQKLVSDRGAAHERIHEHCLELDNARALQAHGRHSPVGMILDIHHADPGQIHVVLGRQLVGF
jgi:hypothetical protein